MVPSDDIYQIMSDEILLLADGTRTAYQICHEVAGKFQSGNKYAFEAVDGLMDKLIDEGLVSAGDSVISRLTSD